MVATPLYGQIAGFFKVKIGCWDILGEIPTWTVISCHSIWIASNGNEWPDRNLIDKPTIHDVFLHAMHEWNMKKVWTHFFPKPT